VVQTALVSAEEIKAGCLEDFDVLAMPGGKCAEQSGVLGPEGRLQITAFVENGGGYLGICAGAFLASAFHDPFPSWRRQSMGVGLLPARTVRSEAPDCIPENSRVQLTEQGRALLWDEGREWQQEELEEKEGLLTIRYYGGPLLLPSFQEQPGETEESVESEDNDDDEEEEIPAWVLAMCPQASVESQGEEAVHKANKTIEKDPAASVNDTVGQEPLLPAFQQLATFSAETETEQQAMMGATAIAYSRFGAGAVLCISPHPESTMVPDTNHPTPITRMQRLVQRAVYAVARPKLGLS